MNTTTILAKSLAFMALLSPLSGWTASTRSNPGSSLTIRWENPQQLALVWPTSAVLRVLEYRTNLSSAEGWLPWPVEPAQAGERWSVTVTVAGDSRFFRLHALLPPDPATVAPALDATGVTSFGAGTAFLYSGDESIQTGVAPGAIESRRAAVLRGKVRQSDGSPLPGVTVSVLNHAEFGQTLSRADGMFDLAVNGGGPLTVNYAKAGLLPAQRQAQAPWQDYAWLPEVILIPLDPQVTTLDLTSAEPMQVARGTLIGDADGMRQATILVPQGTTATMVLSDGSTQPLTTLNVRITEYTEGPNGPKAMPAELPPNVAYTYCVALTADEAVVAGAKRVQLNRPLINYVDNFLNFPIGTPVPLGNYDREAGRWVDYDSGTVINILSIAGGLADIDTDGNGAPDDETTLAALGITPAERSRLAALYPIAPKSLWRTLIPHFSDWDANMGTRCKDNKCDMPDRPEPDPSPPDSCEQTGSSVIGCQSQTLGEDMGIAGTPFSLHYQSSRTRGYDHGKSLFISLNGSSVQENLQTITLEIKVAGRSFQQSFTPSPNLSSLFTWDGKDAYGRTVQGSAPISVGIGYGFPLEYIRTARFGYNGSGNVSVGLPRDAAPEFRLWQRFDLFLDTWEALSQGLGGWTLDMHHTYDPAGRVLYQGDGTRRQADNLVVKMVAGGSGRFFPWIEGVPATEVVYYSPLDIAFGQDGSFYMADWSANQVYRVDANGIHHIFAGRCQQGGFEGDGGWATNALLNYPSGAGVGPDGSVYIADQNNNRIRRVTADGIIHTVAGGGSPEDGLGDGLPATQARLLYPQTVDFGPDGTLYIAETGRIRRVGPDGIARTVFEHWGIRDLAVAPDGNLYILDSSGFFVWRLRVSGIMEVAAGVGANLTFSGDGGPAALANINQVKGIALGPDGSLYLADFANGRVRRVSPDGIINTVVGNGSGYWIRDGLPATQTPMVPLAVAVAPDGNLHVLEYTHLVARVGAAFPGFSLTENALPSADGTELFIFDVAGHHLRTRDAFTGATRYTFGHDSAWRLTSVTNGDGLVTTIERDADGKPTAIVAPFGQRTRLSLDANGYLSTIVNPADETNAFTYTAEGLMTARTDPRGSLYQYTYNDAGLLVKAEDPAGGFKALSRVNLERGYEVTVATAEHRTNVYSVERLTTGETRMVNRFPDGTTNVTLINRNGSRTTWMANGTTVALTNGPDPRWGMMAPVMKDYRLNFPGGLTYAVANDVTASLADPADVLSLRYWTNNTTVNGHKKTTVYEAATRTLTTSSPEGRQTVAIKDAQGRFLSLQEGNFAAFKSEYDTAGRLTRSVRGDGAAARTNNFAYNAQGLLDQHTDPLGRSFGWSYDLAERVLIQTLPETRTTTYTYDKNGNQTRVTPPGRPVHEFKYSEVNLVSAYLPPDVGAGANQTSYLYNKDRDLSQVTLPDAQIVDFDYGKGGGCNCGRLNSVNCAHGLISYTYDPITGNLSAITSPDGISIVFAYDGDLLANKTWSGPVAGSVSYTHDSELHIATLHVNGADPINYTYDTDGLLTSAGSLNLRRDPQNGKVVLADVGKVTNAWVFSAFAELSSQTVTYAAAEIYLVTYTRDKVGRITEKTETIGGATDTYRYGYDNAGRLAEVTKNGAVVANYDYDPNGNRTIYTATGSTTTGTYDDQDRLLQYGETTYSHTASGSLLAKTKAGQVTHYDYDALGNLMTVTKPDGTQIGYIFDGQNRRVGKKVNGTLTQGFLYQSPLRAIAELDASGKVVSRFVYGTQRNVPEYMIKDGNIFRIVTDHLGNPRIMVNADTGEIAQQMDYDEFGNVLRDTNPGFQPFGFAGGIYDGQTGLIHLGARDYDPSIGRWTTKDPTTFGGGEENLYGYVANDPINKADPSGLQTGETAGSGSGGNTGHGAAAIAAFAERMLTMPMEKAAQGPWPPEDPGDDPEHPCVPEEAELGGGFFDQCPNGCECWFGYVIYEHWTCGPYLRFFYFVHSCPPPACEGGVRPLPGRGG